MEKVELHRIQQIDQHHYALQRVEIILQERLVGHQPLQLKILHPIKIFGGLRQRKAVLMRMVNL